MLKNFSNNKKYSGFSFIEVILSVFLISTGMIAVMSLMSTSLRDSLGSRDQIVGVLLSQEGIELVRNLRDNNWANDRNTFDTGTSSGFPNTSSVANCVIDSLVKTTLSCGDNPQLKVYPLSMFPEFVNGGSGPDTKFQRKIEIKYDNDTDKNSAEITSVVIWGNNFPANPVTQNNCNTANKCTYARTILTRWGGN